MLQSELKLSPAPIVNHRFDRCTERAVDRCLLSGGMAIGEVRGRSGNAPAAFLIRGEYLDVGAHLPHVAPEAPDSYVPASLPFQDNQAGPHSPEHWGETGGTPRVMI